MDINLFNSEKNFYIIIRLLIQNCNMLRKICFFITHRFKTKSIEHKTNRIFIFFTFVLLFYLRLIQMKLFHIVQFNETDKMCFVALIEWKLSWSNNNYYYKRRLFLKSIMTIKVVSYCFNIVRCCSKLMSVLVVECLVESTVNIL